MIVLDASAVVAYWNARDAHHKAARSLMEDLDAGRWGRGILPEYVFLEILTVLGRRTNPKKAADIGRLLLKQREIEFVRCARYLPEALGIFRGQDSMKIGLVDATVVAIARGLDDPNVATFDRALAARDDVRVLPST